MCILDGARTDLPPLGGDFEHLQGSRAARRVAIRVGKAEEFLLHLVAAGRGPGEQR